MAKWMQTPDQFGWWFHTDELKNWDLAKPIRVTAYMDGCNGPWIFKCGPYSSEQLCTDKGGWWYGPIEIPRPPDNCEV